MLINSMAPKPSLTLLLYLYLNSSICLFTSNKEYGSIHFAKKHGPTELINPVVIMSWNIVLKATFSFQIKKVLVAFKTMFQDMITTGFINSVGLLNR